MKHRLLFVDDDRENRSENAALLSAAGYRVDVADNGETALRIVHDAKASYSLILMDYHMPGGITGAETARAIKQIKPEQQILAYSFDDSKETMRETFKAGVVDFLDKNVDNKGLLEAVANYCAKFSRLYATVSADNDARDFREKFILETGMVGRSDALMELAKHIRKVAPTTATTLILGESGTGKEVVAKALHSMSDRANRNFVAVNIAAESPALLDSSLFGHRRGAFTGASSDHIGKFQLANHGTIFLDEIGDMSLDLQVKLLRVLQEREVLPLGATTPIPIDVRIIAATHRDLEARVKSGQFREDLYYRLTTITLATTPLRLRTEDIESLVGLFSEQVCSQNGFSRAFHHSCLDVFRAYEWKGNVRELRSVVESHLIRSDFQVIRPEHLDSYLYRVADQVMPESMDEIDLHYERQKREALIRVLDSSKTNTEAARRLKVTESKLYYMLGKWNVGRTRNVVS